MDEDRKVATETPEQRDVVVVPDEIGTTGSTQDAPSAEPSAPPA